MQVAYEDTKADGDWINEHKELVLRAIDESNLPGFLIPHLQKLRRANGSSPIYDAFEAAVPGLCNELIEVSIPTLEEDGFFEEDDSWNEETIKKWIKDKVKTT